MSILVQGNVKRTLFRMAFPMLAGTFAMNAYNFADTWFVAKLGTLPLAAMGFSFPIVMLLTFIAGGIGTGVTTLFSHAIGRHDQKTATRLVTHGVMLTILVAELMSIVGYLSITPVFSWLGADAATMPLIGAYMRTWYLGAVFMVLPMLGNGILISVGDSKSASSFIMLGTILNVILDPIMIFGFMGFPALGMLGAALATVLSEAVSTVWLFYLLIRKHHLLAFKDWGFGDFVGSCRSILGFAVPSIISMMLMPISSAIITGILSRFGNEAVAACGAASRIESFAFIIPMALGISMTPFISQNFGAGRLDRIREAKTISTGFALIYGGFMAVLFFLGAPLLAAIFTDDPNVAGILMAYVRTVSFGYGMMEVHRYCGFILTGMHRPASATTLNAIRILVLLIPLSYIGVYIWGVRGVFAARLITDLTVGSIGLVWVSRVLRTAPDVAVTPLAGSETVPVSIAR
ncbi:MAG TPA: MATE family efflux transporter [Candidatus Ozemobacteraceae bacterium]|nr:MATE family efflux transporter [Candidatus Ozemobacteraceae bacterium]